MEVICTWFWSRDWNQFFTGLGAIATTAGCWIAVCIYEKWITQKKYEVIANEAGRILEEVYMLRNEVFRLNAYGANPSEIGILAHKRDFIEQALESIYKELSKLKTVKNDRTKSYSNSLTDFIRDLQSNADRTQSLVKNMSCAKVLVKDLSQLKFYHFDI